MDAKITTRTTLFALFLGLLFVAPASAFELPETGQVGSEGRLKLKQRADRRTAKLDFDYRFRFHFEDGQFQMRMGEVGRPGYEPRFKGTTEPLGETGRKFRLNFDEDSTERLIQTISGQPVGDAVVRKLKAVVKLAPLTDDAAVRFVLKTRRHPEADIPFRSASARYKGYGFASNALLNPGAEKGLDHWVLNYGGFTTSESKAFSGERAFHGGRFGPTGSYASSIVQEIDLSTLADRVDADEVDVVSGATLLSNANPGSSPDLALQRVTFLDRDGRVLGGIGGYPGTTGYYGPFSSLVRVPFGTRTVLAEIYASRPVGRSTDGYADDVDVAFVPAHPNAQQVAPQPVPLER